MLPLSFTTVSRVLCLGAHADDIEIGMGGTLLSLKENHPEMEIYWAVFSAPGARAQEAEASAEEYLSKSDRSQIKVGSFQESYFPNEWANIKNWFEQIRMKFNPEIVFTHYRDDRHQDHRVLSDLAWNTFRNHLILEYEILKYDGDLGAPNLFVPISEKISNRKIDLLMKHFRTQLNKHWFTRSSFDAMHRIRGVECASPSGLAEGFYFRKAVLIT